MAESSSSSAQPMPRPKGAMSPDGTMSAGGGTERSCSGSGRTRCLFLGRPSGFGTAGVEVGGFRVGTADEAERSGSLSTVMSHGALSVDSQEW